MKITLRTITIVAASCVIGIVAGAAITYGFLIDLYASMTAEGWSLATQDEIVLRVALLEEIRAGRNVQATDTLENLLDGDLISVVQHARNGGKIKTKVFRAIEREREARALSGYKSANADIGTMVNRAFDELAADANREKEK